VADEKSTRELMELFPGARLDVTKIYGGPERAARARHKALDLYQMIEMTFGLETLKMHRYGELLRSMLRDQIQWIKNPAHRRKITDANGRDSLAQAVEATQLAEESREGEAPAEPLLRTARQGTPAYPPRPPGHED
jgi:hypothetical protein